MRAMADVATKSITIHASAEHCYAVAADFVHYPDWAQDVKETTVRATDDAGRATEVEFRASALGRSTHYTLAYDHTDAPGRLKWQLVKGDIMRAVDGEYTFTVTGPNSCEVVYDLSIELVVPIPGFVKRRAEVRILSTLEELKARAEA
jgi:ribosome-associated toxin RatA of RatAB toxin-antitoxin module